MSDRLDEGRGLWLQAVVLTSVAVFVIFDVLEDIEDGASKLHIGMELTVFCMALLGLAMLMRYALSTRREARMLHRSLAEARADAHRWQQEAQGLLRGLGEAIDQQFERWELTQAERDVGLLLLKGLSHKEICQIRETSERTVRQQSLALYRKSGLAGRAELAAFFLEDLLLPQSMEMEKEPVIQKDS